MNSRRKLLISMLAIVFVLLAVVATVAIAFALTQQTITTTLNIGYVVEDIDGTASATYTIGGVTESLTAKKGNQVIGETLVFHAGDTEDAGNLMFPEGQIPLSAQNDNIVIQYTYSNTGAKHYIASMSFDGNISADNMKVEYSIDGTTYSENRYAVVVPANTASKSYWIKISIENKAKSASFKGDFRWLLSGCDEQEDSYLSLTSLEFQQVINWQGNAMAGRYKVGVATSGAYVGELVFPSSVNGDPVTTIAENSSLTQEQKNQVTSVYIPDSVTTIGDNAFKSFTNLQTVTFEQNETAGASVQSGTGLTSIGGGAFLDCTGLTTIELPAGLTSIVGSAFSRCIGLTTIELPAGLTSIGYAAFSDCTGLTSIELPAGLTSIGVYAFYGCTGLKEITIPASVTTIGSDAFYRCANLKDITTHTLNDSVIAAIKSIANANGEMNLTIETVTSIPSGCFQNCTGLTDVVLTDAVSTVGSYAFSECANLTSVTFGCGITGLGYGAFCGTALISITIPASVNSFEDCFLNCSQLTDVVIEGTSSWLVQNFMTSTDTTLTSSDLQDTKNNALLVKDYGLWRKIK